jgi:hypothetical protein
MAIFMDADIIIVNRKSVAAHANVAVGHRTIHAHTLHVHKNVAVGVLKALQVTVDSTPQSRSILNIQGVETDKH